MGRRRWTLASGAVVLIGLGGVLAVGLIQQNSANDDFQSFRDSIAVPAGWTPSGVENVRLTGLFGVCFTSVFDVRTCPSSSEGYAIDGGYSQETITAALVSSGVAVTATDCEPPSGNGTGRFLVCSVTGEKAGHVVMVAVIGTVSRDATVSNPEGRISIDR